MWSADSDIERSTPGPWWVLCKLSIVAAFCFGIQPYFLELFLFNGNQTIQKVPQASHIGRYIITHWTTIPCEKRNANEVCLKFRFKTYWPTLFLQLRNVQSSHWAKWLNLKVCELISTVLLWICCDSNITIIANTCSNASLDYGLWIGYTEVLRVLSGNSALPLWHSLA